MLRYLPGPKARMDRVGNDWRRGLAAGLNILGNISERIQKTEDADES